MVPYSLHKVLDGRQEKVLVCLFVTDCFTYHVYDLVWIYVLFGTLAKGSLLTRHCCVTRAGVANKSPGNMVDGCKIAC